MNLDKKKLLYVLILNSVLIFFIITPAATIAANHEDALTSKEPIPLQVPLPGKENITDIPSYINAIYSYGIQLLAIVAVLAFIIGGIKYIMSAGNPSKTKEARTLMISTVTGLVLAMLSFVILNTINPTIVELKVEEISAIDKIAFEWNYSDLAGTEQETPGDAQCGGKVPGRENNLQLANLPGIVVSPDLYKIAKYSIKYGPLCETPATPKAIIIHYTAGGSASGAVQWWATNSGSSCQYVIDKDTTIYQTTEKVGEKVICHGSSTAPNWNVGGIGLEVTGENAQTLVGNSTQKAAIVQLVNALATTYNIPKTNAPANLANKSLGGIFSHQQITKCLGARNQKIDPGEQYMRDVLQAVGGTYVDWTGDPNCQKG